MKINFHVLFMGFVMTIPFLHAFSISAWLPLPLYYGIGVLLLYLLSGYHTFFFDKEDIFIIVFLICGILPIVFSVNDVGIKNITHTLAWGITIVIFYFWTNAWFHFANISFVDIGKIATFGLLIASSGVVLDFILANLFGFYLSDILPYSFEEMDVTQSLNGLLFRPRGFSAEPGFTAVVFEMFFPLAWIYLRQNRQKKVLIYSFSIVAYLLLTSAASISALLFASCMSFILFPTKIMNSFIRISVFVFLTFLIMILLFPNILIVLNDIYDQVVGIKIDRMLMSDDIRVKIYESLMQISIYEPQGIGFGTISKLFSNGIARYNDVVLYGPGAINLYLEILIASGICGFLCFLLFVFFKIRKAYKFKNTIETRVILFSLFTVMFHHSLISEVWFPMLWFLLVISNNMANLVNEKKSHLKFY